MRDNMSDIVQDYVIKRPVQAVRLDDAVTIARVGRWMMEHGAICTWVSASGTAALAKAGEGANRITLHKGDNKTESVSLGDWVVHIDGSEFLLVSDRNFAEIYAAKPAGVQGELEE